MIRTTSTHRRTLAGLTAMLALPALLIGLSACAPASGGNGSQTPDAGAGQQLTLTEWQLKYSACMRDEGIDMPDPDAAGTLTVTSGGDPAAMEAAAQKCRADLGDPPPISAEEKEAAEQQALEWGKKVAECYRENGYDMPDPKAGEQLQWPADAPEDVQDECGGASGVARSTTGN